MPGLFRPRLVAFNFTTDGSGNLTVSPTSDPQGQVSVTKSGNNYIIRTGQYKALLLAEMFGTARYTTTTQGDGTLQMNFGSSQNNVANGYFLGLFDT